MSRSSHTTHPKKTPEKQKRRAHVGRNASILGFIILLALIAYAEFRPLTVNDFYFSHTTVECGFDNATHYRWDRIFATLTNNKNAPFHYISADILLIDFTLKDGTDITVNNLYVDRNSTFGTDVIIKWQATSNLPVGQSTPVADLHYVLTIHVQELAEPIILPFTVSAHDLSC